MREQLIECPLNSITHRGIIVVGGHEVDVEIAVAGMTEGGDREVMARLQVGGELDQLDESTAGHNNVLVQFR